jgi:hypothetical protein
MADQNSVPDAGAPGGVKGLYAWVLAVAGGDIVVFTGKFLFYLITAFAGSVYTL